jgi:hypothetical protein
MLFIFYEGFGLPAQKLCVAKRLIFANNSSLPEVVGEGGLQLILMTLKI